MTLHFIDTENLGGVWMDYVIQQYSQDSTCKFLIFATEKTAAIPWHYLDKFRKIKNSALEFCEAHNGEKNALDFCLVARLGEEVSRNRKHNFIIVSKDKGFDSAINYLGSRYQANIERVSSFLITDNAEKSVNIQRRDYLAALCEVSPGFADQLRVRLFAEKETFSPYENSLEYTLQWLLNSRATTLKKDPSLRNKLAQVLTQQYTNIIEQMHI